MAILDGREVAFILIMNYQNEGYLFYDWCEYYDENSGLDELEFRSMHTCAPVKLWDDNIQFGTVTFYENKTLPKSLNLFHIIMVHELP